MQNPGWPFWMKINLWRFGNWTKRLGNGFYEQNETIRKNFEIFSKKVLTNLFRGGIIDKLAREQST